MAESDSAVTRVPQPARSISYLGRAAREKLEAKRERVHAEFEAKRVELEAIDAELAPVERKDLCPSNEWAVYCGLQDAAELVVLDYSPPVCDDEGRPIYEDPQGTPNQERTDETAVRFMRETRGHALRRGVSDRQILAAIRTLRLARLGRGERTRPGAATNEERAAAVAALTGNKLDAAHLWRLLQKQERLAERNVRTALPDYFAQLDAQRLSIARVSLVRVLSARARSQIEQETGSAK